MTKNIFSIFISCVLSLSAMEALAGPIYLNQSNITVSVGAGTSPGTFNNTFDNGQTINKVIDAPSADAEEFHTQATHIWFTANEVGGGLELIFDFLVEYDLTMLHFWNYTAEAFDVDQIDFTFYNSLNIEVGELSVFPSLGTSPGITAEDILLAAPFNVQYVSAFLTGTNRQVDFQNIGFTAQLSEPVPVPEPSTIILAGLGLLGLRLTRKSRTT